MVDEKMADTMYPDDRVTAPAIFDCPVKTPDLNIDNVLRLLRGESIVYIIEGLIPLTDCQKVERAFRNYRGEKYDYGYDEPMPAIGLPLYKGDAADAYFGQSVQSRKALAKIFDEAGVPNWPERMVDQMRALMLHQGLALRPVRH